MDNITFYRAATFVAGMIRPGTTSPFVQLEFRFGELTMFAGDRCDKALVRMAVPPVCYCDVSLTPEAIAALSLADGPLEIRQLPSGGVLFGHLLEAPPAAPIDPEWINRVKSARPAHSVFHSIYAAAWASACAGLNSLSNFPTMGNPVLVEPYLDWHILRPDFTLAPGVTEAWALVGKV